MEQYQAPKSQVEQHEVEEFSTPKVFGVSGRIGRLRFIAYGFLAMVVFMLFIALMGGLSAVVPALGIIGMVIGYLGLLVYNFMIAIQRSHDLDINGWFSIVIVMFAFIFWFIPGTRGPNRYGAVPKPNHAGIYIAALVFPVAYIGILVAIAIPAYQGYIERAQQQQIEQSR